MEVTVRSGAGPDPGRLTLDGSHGEGGGQILRSALALAVALCRPVALTRIRARRPKPGLRPQHLAVVRALAEVGDAAVVGDALGSTALEFTPRALRGGSYRFDIGAITGSAGSVSLLFQALLLPLALAGAPSRLTLIGGTHVPWSPPVHYLTEVFLPALAGIGVQAQLLLRRWGWYPAGGGEVEAGVEPTGGLGRFVPGARGGRMSGLSAVSRLPRSIAERQRRRAEARLAAAGLVPEIAIEEDATARGPGTFLFLAAPGRAGFSALGRRGVPAERVADEAVDAFLAFHAAGADVDEHLADQLVPFLALAGAESAFTCPVLSGHLRTVAWVVQQFVPVRIALEEGTPARVRIAPAQAGSGSKLESTCS
ncbi:MAG TPA: RNA 3'-terminal phosphate cyclase [Methylomirabilota bacterium]|nr:RNA 3'-terminal phosphate cyclase [Methylomirabilota bacterium]